jgi:outer membrane receptor for ferrienterochelin and colicins
MKSSQNILYELFLCTVMLLPNVSLVFAQEREAEAEVDLTLEDLFNVDVTVASKKAEKISDAPGVIYVLTNDELHRTGATTLKELLLRVPSFGFSSTALTSRSLPVMRGDMIKIQSSHILFLLNGRPVREFQEGGNNSDFFENFPVSVIDQIEVIRGPGSVLYGSDAFTGVVNIKTKQPPDRPLAASVTGHYEPPTGGGGMTDVQLKLGDVNIIAGGRYYTKPDWKPTYTHAYWDLEAESLDDSLVDDDIVWDEGPGIFLDINYKGLSLMGSYVGWKASAFQNKNDIMTRKLFGNFGYEVDFTDNWSMNMNFTGVRHNVFTKAPDFIRRKSNNFLLENTQIVTLFDRLNIVAGGTVSFAKGYEKDIATYDGLLVPSGITAEGESWSFAGYTQVDYTFWEQLKLITGVQVNKKRGIKKHIAPRVGGIWHPIKEITVKSFYSEAFRLPSINELYMDYYIGLYGDENLKPEVVKTFDQSVSFQNDRIMVGLNYFYSKQTDIIQQAFKEGDTLWWARYFQNLGEITFSGVEIEGKWYITRELYLNGSMLYQDNHDSVYNVIPFPNFLAKGGISYSDERGITLSLFNTYQGDYSDKYKAGFNSEHQGPFHMLNFSSRFNITKIFTMKSSIKPSLLFKVDNIIGKESWVWEYGGFTDQAIPLIRGREFYIGLNLTL